MNRCLILRILLAAALGGSLLEILPAAVVERPLESLEGLELLLISIPIVGLAILGREKF